MPATNEPAGDGMHDVAPELGWYVPSVHCVSETEPVPLTKFPGLAGVHDAEPAFGWNCPVAHCKADVEPADGT